MIINLKEVTMEIQTKRVLVAGATGYLGAFVAKEFKKRGYFVRALVRDPMKLMSAADDYDEIIKGDVTQSETLRTVCDDIDLVFSSVGITKQKSGQTWKDVDYLGNTNLLDEAINAGVRKFIYVSVFNGAFLKKLEIVKAHEDFVDELESSGIDYTIIRPNGFFSDMSEILKMAQKGSVYLFGDGESRVNPIHGADLAVICADAAANGIREINVGGPEVLTFRQIGHIAEDVLGQEVKIVTVPMWLANFAIAITRVFNRHAGELLAFFSYASTHDAIAPSAGSHTLKNYFSECLEQERR